MLKQTKIIIAKEIKYLDIILVLYYGAGLSVCSFIFLHIPVRSTRKIFCLFFLNKNTDYQFPAVGIKLVPFEFNLARRPLRHLR